MKYFTPINLIKKVTDVKLLLEHSLVISCFISTFSTTFVDDRTRHASHQNSAPRRVFDFKGEGIA